MTLRPYKVSEPWLLAEANGEVDYFGAIVEFAGPRFAALAKRAISRMQRFDASGIFEGEAQGLRSLWDEFCWYQEYADSDTPLLSSAMDHSICEFIDGVIGELPRPEAVLLTCAAIEDQALMPALDPEVLRETLRDVISKAAGKRDMSRFEVQW